MLFGLLFLCVPYVVATIAGNDARIFDTASYAAQDVIQRDVAVIGGGSSGMYTAVHLKDAQKTVAVIEQKPVIGGHAETFLDPVSKKPINLGVIVFGNTSIVKQYFGRFNVPLKKLVDDSGPALDVNFNTGKVVKNYVPPSTDAVLAAFQGYAGQLAKSGVATGSSFNLTYPIAPDLLLPFGQFVQKYNLGGFMRSVFTINQGYAPLLNISTLYMFKYLNAVELGSIQNGFLTSGTNNTHSLYDAIQSSMASDIFLSSTITGVDRSSPSEVKISIQQGGISKLIIAKKLVSCIPPLVDNLKAYDLAPAETRLFKQFFVNGYYTGTLNNTGLVRGLGALEPNQPYWLQTLPNPYGLSPIPGTTLTSVYYGSPSADSAETVQQRIGEALNRHH